MMTIRNVGGPFLFILIIIGTISTVGMEAVFYQNPTPVPMFGESSRAGVALNVSVNSTILHPGQRLNVTVSLDNKLTVSNYLRVADDWTVRGFPVSIWPGCLFSLPVEFVIIRGNLSLSQIEAMGNSTAPGTLCMEATAIDHVIFQPKSSDVTLTGTYCGGACVPNQVYGPYHLVSNFTVDGYWNYPLTINDSNDLYSPYDGGVTFRYPEVGPVAAHTFEPGVYTLVVTDEWGQDVLLHFTVTQNGGGGAGLLIHVLNDTTGQPMAGVRVIAGPASSMNDTVYTPGGPTVKECVHQVPSGSSVLANGTVVLPNGTMLTFPTCPLSSYSTNSTGWVTISGITSTYYFFYAGNAMSSFNSFGIVQLFHGEATYVTVKAPSGNYTVTN